MRHPHSFVHYFSVILLMATSVSTLGFKNFELEAILDRKPLINYLSSVLCSIDLKNAHIYFEPESAGTFLNEVVIESSKCVNQLTLTTITYKEAGDNVLTNATNGARLIILISSEFENEKSMFPKLIRIREKFNSELFYMIVSVVRMSADHENLLKLIYRNYNLLNAVVVAMEVDRSDPTVITYNPFNDTIVQIPTNAHKKAHLFVTKNANIFGSPLNIVKYEDLAASLHHYMTSSSTTTSFNYDSFLPGLISSAMNATLHLSDPSMEKSKIEEFEAADLIINGRSYKNSVAALKGLESTINVRRDDICILLPYNRIRNTFEIIYRMVDPLVWLLMIAVIFQTWISLVIVRWVQFLTQQSNLWKSVFLLDLFGLHMNQGLTHMPRRVPPRFIILSCLMYCLVIKTIFEGVMYTSMAKKRETRLTTVDELLNSNEHEILISNVFYNTSEQFINNSPIKNQFRVVEYSQFINRYIKRADSNPIQYAFVLRRRVAKYLENTQIVNGAPVYYTMDECIVPFSVCYFVQKGSQFLDRINKILRITAESGILGYWERQVTNVYTKLKQNQRLFAQRSAINFKQLTFVFQALGYGLAIATTVFVFERLQIMKWYRPNRIQVD